METNVPRRDWVLTRIETSPHGGFNIEGENLNYAHGHKGRRFFWNLDYRHLADPRYDGSRAIISPEAASFMERFNLAVSIE